LVFGKDGVLYGTTSSGGPANAGTVYSLTPPAAPGGAWTETVLYNFTGRSDDGSSPNGPLVIGGGGVLYGTTFVAGTNNLGIVFSLTPAASPGNPWTLAVLHNFAGGSSDGAEPATGLTLGYSGVLYGTTLAGGPGACNFEPPGCGTVFQLTTPVSPGGTWTESVLHTFDLHHGGRGPTGPLAIGPHGELYGTTELSGAEGGGTVFALTPPSQPGGAWTETVLSNQLGGEIYGGVVVGKSGILYGTTDDGGYGYGTVYALRPPGPQGGAWIQKGLYSFLGSPDGDSPAGLAIGDGGVLYGATSGGGTSQYGTVFSLKPPAAPGGVWTETVLYSLTYSDGIGPGFVIVGRNKLLYGTTISGALFYGTVFSLKP
jgi:uncharacterized repeat protein (TIGR03803 family)